MYGGLVWPLMDNKKPAFPGERAGSCVLLNHLNHDQMVPEAGIEPARLAARDFESRASTNSTTRATLQTKT